VGKLEGKKHSYSLWCTVLLQLLIVQNLTSSRRFANSFSGNITV